jgi:hypothetical protein
VFTLNFTYKSHGLAQIHSFPSPFIRITIPLSIHTGISTSISTFFLILLCHQHLVHIFSKISQVQAHLSQVEECSIVQNIVCCLYLTYQLQWQSGHIALHSHHNQLQSLQTTYFSYFNLVFHQTIEVFKSIFKIVSMSSQTKLDDLFLLVFFHPHQKNCSKISHKSTSNHALENPPLQNGLHQMLQ